MGLLGSACASSSSSGPPNLTGAPTKTYRHTVPDDAQVSFRGDRVLVGRKAQLTEIPGVSKDDLIWAPDGARFAYAKTFEEFGKLPKSLLRIEVHEAYLHCPKALMRADLWGDSHKVDRATLPSLSEMVMDQLGLGKPEVTHEQQVASLKQTL